VRNAAATPPTTTAAAGMDANARTFVSALDMVMARMIAGSWAVFRAVASLAGYRTSIGSRGAGLTAWLP